MDEEVKALLQVWGLEEYIEIFTANKIDINCLSLLDATLAKELIVPIGDRAKFLKNLENFKKTLPETNLISDENDISVTEDLSIKFVDKLSEKHRRVVPLEEVININYKLDESDIVYYATTPKATSSPSSSSPAPGCSDTQTPTAATVTHNLHLEELLKSTAEGKSIINAHNKNGMLTSSHRRKLSNLIIKHLLGEDPEKRIDSTILMDYAQQIKLLFSKEIISTYYIPYVNNTNLKIKRCAKGKLYDCLQNRRREYRDNKKTRTPDQSAPSTSHQSADEGEDLDEDIIFLRNTCEPWSLVEEKWHSTVKLRLKQLHESQMTVAQYMSLYPALKKSTGFHLLLEDFNHIHPGQENNFLENFQLHKDKLLNLLFKRNQRNQDSTIEEILKNCEEHHKKPDVKSQEATSIYTLTLLALTLAQPQTKNKKATWRPSRIESKDGFITHITRPMDLMETLNRRRDKFSKLGVTLQPFILIVGPNAADIQTYYIVVNDTFYTVNSILEAVDACYKSIFALQCNYPQESFAVWTFIQKAFYRMKTPWDKEFVAVNTLLSDFS